MWVADAHAGHFARCERSGDSHLPQLAHGATHLGRVDDVGREFVHLAIQIDEEGGRLQHYTWGIR
jgi:hypothetical protein